MKKKVITILLIGETGTGKTTFMSLLVNLFQGNGPFELVDKNDPKKESGLSKSKSQTTKATLYTVTTAEGTNIQILDTPGLADTRGLGQDNQHKAEINSAIKEFVTSVDAVLIMANGTVQRLGVATSYTLSVISTMFPRSIVNNIGFIFTHSELLGWDFDMQSLEPELRNAQCWLLQNPLALGKKYAALKRTAPANVLKGLDKEVQKSYERTVETLNEWLEWLDEQHAQPTKQIDDLYQKSNRIESKMDETLSRLARLRERSQECKDIESKLKDTAKVSRLPLVNSNLARRQMTPVWDRQPSNKPNTLCIASNCYNNCHAPCSLEYLLNPAEIGRRCAAFPSQTNSGPQGVDLVCNECGHKAEMHRHYYNIHIKKPREMEPSTKRQLDEATTQGQKLEAALNAMRRELETIGHNILQEQDYIGRLVDEYNTVSLNRNFAGHIRSAIRMLELRKEELSGKAGADDELKIIDDGIAKFELKLSVLRQEEKDANQTFAGRVRNFFV
ncbi:hypothetical protein BDV93DRAFT_581916 [Ceratobasidium sp. AG-I]|nr:hypothetical protein BDV93DRAFT_581916 [Ceratobasidium sp. AG-I]